MKEINYNSGHIELWIEKTHGNFAQNFNFRIKLHAEVNPMFYQLPKNSIHCTS